MKQFFLALLSLISLTVSAQQPVNRDNTNGQQVNVFHGTIETDGIRIPKDADDIVWPSRDSIGLLKITATGNFSYHNGITWVDVRDGFVNVKDYGAKGDGVTDDTEAILDAYEASQYIYLPTGVYIANSELLFDGTVHLLGDGIDKTIIKSGPFSIEDYPDRALIYLKSPEPTDLGLIDADVNYNDASVTLQAFATLAPGQIVALHNTADYSYSGYRPEYKEGEFLIIKDSVNAGTNVEFTSRLLGSNYPDDTTRLYKMNMLQSCRIEGMTIIGTVPDDLSRTTALKADGIANSQFKNVKVLGASSANATFLRSFNNTFENFQVNKTQDDETSTSYGLSFANCQNITGNGLLVSSTRHALSIGGDDEGVLIVNRNIDFENCDFATVEDNSAFDLHGNSENCSVNNSVINGGLITGGHNNDFINNTVTNLYNGACVIGSELKSSVHKISGNTFNVNQPYKVDGAVGYIELGGEMELGGTLDLSDNTINYNHDAANTTVSLFQVYKLTYATDVKISAKGNKFKSSANTALVRGLYIRKASGRTNYAEVYLAGNEADSCSLGLIQHTDNVIVTNMNKISRSDRQGLYINDVGNFVFTNNWLKDNNQSSSGTSYLNGALMVLTSNSGYIANNINETNGAQGLYGYSVRDVPSLKVGTNSSTGHVTSKYNFTGTTVASNILELPVDVSNASSNANVLLRASDGSFQKISGTGFPVFSGNGFSFLTGASSELVRADGSKASINNTIRGTTTSSVTASLGPVTTSTTFNDAPVILQNQVNAKADKVGSGDIEITDTTKGYIHKSPDGTRYRITVANGGTLTVTALP